MFQFTGLSGNPGINACLTATPSLSQPSTPNLLTPRHPPYALLYLTTLTPDSESPKRKHSERATIRYALGILRCHSICCQIVKDRTPLETQTVSREQVSKVSQAASLARGGILSLPQRPVNLTSPKFSEIRFRDRVETIGLEPTTPGLQSRCSPN